MSVFPRILVAVGDDDLSKPAIQMAIRLARDQGAKLRLAYVSEVVPTKASSAQDLAELESTLREEGNAILHRVTEQAEAQGVDAESARLSIGTVKDSIAEALARDAEEWGADLVITGSHGRKGIVRWLAGSVAESLARVSRVPVLIVRDAREQGAAAEAPEA
ncbi:MAG: universal stress protein [Hydrogenophaga sp.]|jgi:nucleotide-binding universal stress UspA family protein|uniref:universal stress protein n=1 Tax=Hydrogenophaga sp. TaxID=1904254 RepID=UPI002623AAE7|nr:universal stress protein [Hydrogenophaga sp.]MCV0441190.1 universal stress protein [Hydrogenophaga sp.]